MAPSYKLTYFEAKGLAEPIRYLLSYGGVDFEDIRIDYNEWPKIKPSLPFDRLPIFEEDGNITDQSCAVSRHLAKKFGLMGSTEWEAVRVDATVDTITDLRVDMAKYLYENVEEAKAKTKETLEKEKIPSYLTKLDNLLKNNGGYFVGGKLTWADLQFAALNDLFTKMWEQKPIIEDYPHLKSLVEKVNNLPRIKDWIEKRPVTEW